MTSPPEYEVRNTAGTLLLTSPERDIAVTWAEAEEARRGPLYVEKVVRIERRTIVHGGFCVVGRAAA